MLGNAIEISRGVNDLDASTPYYEKIGFKMIQNGKSPQNWALFSDGRLNIRLIEQGEIFTGFMYYNEKLPDLIKKLDDAGVEFTSTSDNEINFKDPNGFRITVMNKSYDDSVNPNLFADSNNQYGYFGEFAIPITDFDKVKEFWEKIGYVKMVEMDEPYKWGIMTDGRMVIGLHQNDKQEAEAVTYFTTNMKDQIHKLQRKGIDFHEGYQINLEEGNGITYSPDGLMFFFFEGEIIMPEEYKKLLK